VELFLEMVERHPLIRSRACDGLQSFMSVSWMQWCSLEAPIVCFPSSSLLFSFFLFMCHCAMIAFPPVLIMCPCTGNLGWGASVVFRGLT
jgi:hypothetical protein